MARKHETERKQWNNENKEITCKITLMRQSQMREQHDDQSKLIWNTTNLALPTGRAQEFFFKAREREAPSEMRSEQIF